MIDHQYKCVFVHQRKCAGTAIIHSFGKTLDMPDWHFGNDGLLSPEWSQIPTGYYKFSVVRNPWDRFVSGWKYCESTKHLSLIEALRHLPAEGFDYRHVTRPQADILMDDSGSLVVDCLVRFETLQADFDRVCDRLGRPRTVLTRVNCGSRLGYRDYFDDDGEARRLFRDRFGRDAALFGYDY